MLRESINAYLAPYMLGLWFLGALALLALGFAGGCRWNKGERLEAEAKQHDAELDRDGWKYAAGLWETAIKEQNREAESARAKAAKEQERLDEAVERANLAADRFAKRLVELKHRDAADRADPNCNEIARMRVCGSPLR